MNGKTMDYVTFGKGKQKLVIIPGLGDGLQTVKGKAQLFSLSYRLLAKRYKIYVFSRIKDENRIAIQSQSCLEHNSREVLKEIQCPTFVLGALEDDVIGVDGSKELAKAISDCQLLILKHSGHALYEENKVFQEAVCEFLN